MGTFALAAVDVLLAVCLGIALFVIQARQQDHVARLARLERKLDLLLRYWEIQDTISVPVIPAVTAPAPPAPPPHRASPPTLPCRRPPRSTRSSTAEPSRRSADHDALCRFNTIPSTRAQG